MDGQEQSSGINQPLDTSRMTPMRRGSVSMNAVRQELVAKEKNMGTKLLVLAVSFLIFAGAGLLNYNPINLALIVLVLLIHEAGHWIGMKMFKYNDVQMFFIPGFGAAVSGQERTPCARQKAIVSLLGPIPGIIIGIVCIAIYFFVRNPLWSTAGSMFLVINGFNLLPITPFDGGRFVEAVLFTRHPRAEVGFKVVAVLALGYLAYEWKSIVLGVVAWFSLISIKYVWGIAQSTRDLRGELREGDALDGDEIPDEWLSKIIHSLDGVLPEVQKKPKIYATAARTIWNRMRVRHCSVIAAVGLCMIYLLFLTPVTGLMVVSGMVARQNAQSSKPDEPILNTAEGPDDQQDGAFEIKLYDSESNE